jgi:DNA-binding NtrC family response regulator
MNKMQLLFIDDEKSALQSFVAQFRTDFKIFTAENIDDARKIIEKENINVVLCDYMLKGTDGIQFFSELKISHPNISRILITGLDGTKIALDAINIGNIYRFVQKPWDEYELKIVINQAYEHNKLILENIAMMERLMSNEKLIQMLTELKK